MYYQVQVTIETPTPKGGVKKGNEQYLVDAVSCLDAEKKVNDKFVGATLDWEVSKISKSKIVEVIDTTLNQ